MHLKEASLVLHMDNIQKKKIWLNFLQKGFAPTFSYQNIKKKENLADFLKKKSKFPQLDPQLD